MYVKGPNWRVRKLWVGCATQVTRAVFEASKGRLKVVGRAGVGIDNVDLAAATEVGGRAGLSPQKGCVIRPIEHNHAQALPAL